MEEEYKSFVACISTKSHYLSYKTFQYAICEVRAVQGGTGRGTESAMQDCTVLKD